MDLPTADREQLAAFIVRIFALSCHHSSRITSHCLCSAMNVCWSSGPLPSRPSFLPVMISRTVLLSYCGEPVPRSRPPLKQRLLQTQFLAILHNLPIHSRPLSLPVTVLSSVSSLPPRVLALQIPSQPPVPVIPKRVSWKQGQRQNELGTVKSTLSESIQTRRFLALPCYMPVYTMA